MPEYLVRFDQPMRYQPDHPLVNLITPSLTVHAPTAEDAVMHAMRVTRGAGRIVSVCDVAESPEEAKAVSLSLTGKIPDPNEPVDA